MTTNFIQLHYLTSYPAVLLNRDDAGFAKRMPFGGAIRTRISSQCLKRHWRTFDGQHSLRDLGVPMSVRSRRTFEKYILGPLLDDGIDPGTAQAVTQSLMGLTLGESAKAKKAKEGEELTARTGQITILGRPELDYLLQEAREVCAEAESAKEATQMLKKWPREKKDNLKALRHAAGLDAALFGRMVTSDILARGDAAIHVAHAFTVHAEAAESDYFSAVDDLLQSSDEEELGSGHIGSVELTSGLFYGYTVIDVPLLVSNLEGCPRADWQDADRSLAAAVVEQLVHLMATVSPGAKLGSTAPYSYANLVLLEGGPSQPRTLANAFLRPVQERPDVVENAYRALATHASSLDAMYGQGVERKVAAIGQVAGLLDGLSVDCTVPIAELAASAASMVQE
jgi:CRISPR system Cascade subunit CasC